MFLVVPVGRLAHLWSIWCKRVADSEGRPRPEPFSPDELGSRGRRVGAFVIDTLLGCVAALFVAIPFSVAGLSTDERRARGEVHVVAHYYQIARAEIRIAPAGRVP